MTQKNKKRITNGLLYAILTIGALTMLLPFFWMISTSFKTAGQAVAMPPVWLPKDPQISNYEKALSMAPFGKYFLNSVIVTIISTTGELITTILAAFAFSRLEFYGKNIIFMLLISTMMVPGELLTIPNFVTLSKWQLINTYPSLFLPFLANIFSIYILKEAFEAIPDEIYYAAKVDGSSDWRYLWTVMVPMAKSSIVSIAILGIVGSWNSFMWPLIVTTEQSMRTLPVGLQAFTTEAGTQFELLMAASTIVVIPMVIVYLFLQKNIIEGLASGGSKG